MIASGRRSLPSAYAGLPARRRSAVSVRSPHQWCGLLRQFGSGLRAGFAAAFRCVSRVNEFLLCTCHSKNKFNSACRRRMCEKKQPTPSHYTASAARRKCGVLICHDMCMANLFIPRGPRKFIDFAGRGRCRACPTDEVEEYPIMYVHPSRRSAATIKPPADDVRRGFYCILSFYVIL